MVVVNVVTVTAAKAVSMLVWTDVTVAVPSQLSRQPRGIDTTSKRPVRPREFR